MKTIATTTAATLFAIMAFSVPASARLGIAPLSVGQDNSMIEVRGGHGHGGWHGWHGNRGHHYGWFRGRGNWRHHHR